MRRLAGALIGVWLILSQPALVLGSADSPLNYGAKWWIPNSGPYASVCVQSGIHDVAVNYGQIVIKNWVSGSCSGSNRNVPSGFLGTSLVGYGPSYCGATDTYYSNVSTSAWQLWASLCPNPSGLQSFHTLAYGYYWTGASYQFSGGWTSPSQNY